MGRDESWPTTVPNVVVFSFSFSEAVHTTMHTMYTTKVSKLVTVPTDRESDGRFWIGKPGFLFKFSSNHASISLSFGDIRIWQTDGWMDNADHYYSWPPHCDWQANNINIVKLVNIQYSTETYLGWTDICHTVLNWLCFGTHRIDQILQQHSARNVTQYIHHIPLQICMYQLPLFQRE